MKTLYISDLDGTLLNEKAELSEYTIQALNLLISKGVNFSFATARTAASTNVILQQVNINLPVVLMNGVLVYDRKNSTYLKVETLMKKSVKSILSILKSNNMTGFMYEVKDNKLATYYENLSSKGLKDFHDERVTKYNKNFIKVTDFSTITSDDIIYFCLLDTKEQLDIIYQLLKNIDEIAIAYYKDIYSDDLWYIEIFSNKATKYNAALFVKEYCNFDMMIGFGDNLNDLPLFQACDECYAVENAKDEVKTVSTAIIGSNLNDGVVRWLLTKNH